MGMGNGERGCRERVTVLHVTRSLSPAHQDYSFRLSAAATSLVNLSTMAVLLLAAVVEVIVDQLDVQQFGAGGLGAVDGRRLEGLILGAQLLGGRVPSAQSNHFLAASRCLAPLMMPMPPIS